MSDTPIIPVYDLPGNIYPAAGDTFTILPGLAVRLIGTYEVDMIAPDGSIVSTVSGTDFLLTGVHGWTFTVASADH